jgi:hypothetical protein
MPCKTRPCVDSKSPRRAGYPLRGFPSPRFEGGIYGHRRRVDANVPPAKPWVSGGTLLVRLDGLLSGSSGDQRTGAVPPPSLRRRSVLMPIYEQVTFSLPHPFWLPLAEVFDPGLAVMLIVEPSGAVPLKEIVSPK